MSTLTSRSPGMCQNGPGLPSAFLYVGSKVKRITLSVEGGPGDEARKVGALAQLLFSVEGCAGGDRD